MRGRVRFLTCPRVIEYQDEEGESRAEFHHSRVSHQAPKEHTQPTLRCQVQMNESICTRKITQEGVDDCRSGGHNMGTQTGQLVLGTEKYPNLQRERFEYDVKLERCKKKSTMP